MLERRADSFRTNADCEFFADEISQVGSHELEVIWDAIMAIEDMAYQAGYLKLAQGLDLCLDVALWERQRDLENRAHLDDYAQPIFRHAWSGRDKRL